MKDSKLKRLSEHSHEVSRVLKVIAHPARLVILSDLREGEKTVGQLIELLGIRQTRVSQHLAALRAGGAVSCRRSGHLVYYSISDPVFVAALDLVLTHHQEVAEPAIYD
jgi:DNA-binding transcriptional ArsR family regulator